MATVYTCTGISYSTGVLVREAFVCVHELASRRLASPAGWMAVCLTLTLAAGFAPLQHQISPKLQPSPLFPARYAAPFSPLPAALVQPRAPSTLVRLASSAAGVGSNRQKKRKRNLALKHEGLLVKGISFAVLLRIAAYSSTAALAAGVAAPIIALAPVVAVDLGARGGAASPAFRLG